MVFGAKLRTVMSSIIRWRNGVTLRRNNPQSLQKCTKVIFRCGLANL
jgi:hypothetical protein